MTVWPALEVIAIAQYFNVPPPDNVKATPPRMQAMVFVVPVGTTMVPGLFKPRIWEECR